MGVYIVMIARILAVTVWCMDSVAALECNGFRFESWLTGHLDKGSVN